MLDLVQICCLKPNGSLVDTVPPVIFVLGLLFSIDIKWLLKKKTYCMMSNLPTSGFCSDSSLGGLRCLRIDGLTETQARAEKAMVSGLRARNLSPKTVHLKFILYSCFFVLFVKTRDKTQKKTKRQDETCEAT